MKKYLVLDERAILGDDDDAMVLVSADSLKEARQDAKNQGIRCCIWEYPFNIKDNSISDGHLIEVVE